MNIKDLRGKTETELKKLISSQREKLERLKFDLAAGKVKNVREIRKIKKEIAQAFTILSELKKEKKDN